MKKWNVLFFRLLAFTIIILSFNKALAQKAMEDVIYLKNGGIIRGIIKDTLHNGNSVKIESIGRNVFVFKAEEIEKITNEEIIEVKSSFLTKKNGYNNISNLGLIMNNGNTILSIQTINSYKFKSHFFAGLGLSIESMNYDPLFSTFIDLRFDLLKGRTTPFIYLDGGYSFPLKNSSQGYWGWNDSKYYGGYLSETGVGIKSNFKNNTAFVFSVGYTYRSLRQSYTDWKGNRIEEIDIFGRFNIRFGFNFN